MSGHFRSSSHLVCFAESYLEKFCAKITVVAVWRCVSVKHCPLLRFLVLVLQYQQIPVGASWAGLPITAEPGKCLEHRLGRCPSCLMGCIASVFQGNVYVKCPSIAAAIAAVNALHGRWFAGEWMTCTDWHLFMNYRNTKYWWFFFFFSLL